MRDNVMQLQRSVRCSVTIEKMPYYYSLSARELTYWFRVYQLRIILLATASV
jgi:hypothetical protein